MAGLHPDALSAFDADVVCRDAGPVDEQLERGLHSRPPREGFDAGNLARGVCHRGGVECGLSCPCAGEQSGCCECHEKSVQNIVVCKVSKKSVSSDSRFARGIPVLLVRIPMLLGWFTVYSRRVLSGSRRFPGAVSAHPRRMSATFISCLVRRPAIAMREARCGCRPCIPSR